MLLCLFLDPAPVIACKYKPERCTQAHADGQVVNDKANADTDSNAGSIE
jgi:hypothetical protein